jgi:PhnB protein
VGEVGIGIECTMRLNPHLTFNGQCEAAFEYYEKCLGGKVVMMMKYGDSPMAEQTSPGWREKIIHATFALGDNVLTGGDAPPESYQKPQGFSVLLHISDAAEADRVFNALAEKGTVQMPVQETFWALRFGMLVDQFGTPWIINCGKPA